MKKSILITTCALATVTLLVHAAEELQKSTCILVNNTVFKVTQGPIYNSQADLIVLGRNQQQKLKPPADDSMKVGMMFFDREDTTMMVLSQEADSTSDDDTYHYFDLDIKSWKHDKAYKKDLNCPVLLIIEPRIICTPVYNEQFNMRMDGYGYFPERKHPTQKNAFLIPKFLEKKAIFEAHKDLGMCFNSVLGEGLTILKDKQHKKIALDALGTAVGIPRGKAAMVTCETIIEFIRNNPGYALIELFVKKRWELRLYLLLFDKYNLENPR